MPYYRICILDEDDQIVLVQNVSYPRDYSVLARAIELINARHGAEVWESDRMVAKLAPTNGGMAWHPA
jgi:hypothetical protein